MLNGHVGTVLKVLPRLAVDENDNFIVEVVYDADGDIQEYKNTEAVKIAIDKMTPKRLMEISQAITKACKEIVNPPKGGGSTGPSKAPQPLPAG